MEISKAMEEIDKKAREISNPLPSPDFPPNKDVVVKRYMLEVRTYPDGREFLKSWLVSKGKAKPKIARVKQRVKVADVIKKKAKVY